MKGEKWIWKQNKKSVRSAVYGLRQAEVARSIVPNVEKIPPRPGEICISICSIVWQGLAPGVRYQKQRSNANTATKHSPATMGGPLHTAAKPVKLQTGYKIPSAPAAENQCLRRMTKETPGGTTGTAPRNAGKNT